MNDDTNEMHASDGELAADGGSGKRVTVRALQRMRHSGGDPRYSATTTGTVRVSDTQEFESEIIGYAEFPANTAVPAARDVETFREDVEARAIHVHWKDGDLSPSRVGRMVAEFTDHHGFSVQEQGLVLAEETGELCEEILKLNDGKATKDNSDPDVRGEIGDVLYTVRTIARLTGDDPAEALRETAEKNARRTENGRRE